MALLALLLWREARGEAPQTRRCVGWTVKNRVLKPTWWGRDWIGVMTMAQQYSSIAHVGDPNTIKYPAAVDTSWMSCMDIATEVYNSSPGFDASQGCTHYFDKSLDDNPPEWASRMTHVFDSGNLRFYHV